MTSAFSFLSLLSTFNSAFRMAEVDGTHSQFAGLTKLNSPTANAFGASAASKSTLIATKKRIPTGRLFRIAILFSRADAIVTNKEKELHEKLRDPYPRVGNI